MNKIAIIGTGYVGLVSGACFAEMGTHVTLVDIREEIVENLKKGKIHIFEPGLAELVKKNIADNMLYFTTSIVEALNSADIIFSAVGTPSDKDGSADLGQVLNVARQIGQIANKYFLLVTKSTVPVGTAHKIRIAVQEELDKRGISLEFDVASNPEFLKEGAAIKDFLSPDRVVIGANSDKAKSLLERLYKPFMLNGERFVFMDVASAEMTKYAANAMLATRISFMNEVASLCEKVGADVDLVRKGIGSDPRIGNKFLYAGAGYGGSCFPKDVKALIHTGNEYSSPMTLVQAVESVNEKQKEILFEKLQIAFAKKTSKKSSDGLKGKVVALWGLAFKPDTDDIREAPALNLIQRLLLEGAEVRVFDPVAMDNVKQIYPQITYCGDKYEAVEGADALVLVTEWRQFRLVDWKKLREIMNGNVLVDGRNIYSASEVLDAGFTYSRIGKAY